MKKKIVRKIRNINEVTFQRLFRKIIGWDEMQEQIDTVHFFMDQYLDISKTKKAEGLLRKVQLADTELLRIVTGILDKHNLTYWLDCGTLIGAVRHCGFIPWDDDLDIAMPFPDFDKAFEVLKEELSPFGIEIGKKTGRIWISNWNAGMIMDIFAMDNVDANQYPEAEQLSCRLREYRKFYKKHCDKSDDFYKAERVKRIGITSKDNPLWFHSIEGDPDYYPRKHSWIFPLKKIQFESYQFNVPNDCDRYLSGVFGDFMSFPKKGILHHKGSGEGVYTNALRKGVDMDELLEKLRAVKIR